jgi:hypothetical protein
MKSDSLERQSPPCKQGCKSRQGSSGSSHKMPLHPGVQVHQNLSPGPSIQAPPLRQRSTSVVLQTEMSHSQTEP